MSWRLETKAENKALDFIQRKKYEYLRANYVLGAFAHMKYFKKKEFSSVLGCGRQIENFGKKRTEQHEVLPLGNSKVKLEFCCFVLISYIKMEQALLV